MEDGKKISFGFSKVTKKPTLGVNSRPKQKIQLIDCLESQTIKLKDAVEEIYTPLVIPMTKPNSALIQRKVNNVKHESTDERPDSELTPDELAARELIRDAQNSSRTGEFKGNLTLSMVSDDINQAEDRDEPTLDDYDNVPITEYGLAMLRGMGWKEGTGIGKNTSIAKIKEPNLRPKGMGLGANITVNKNVRTEANGEELILKKGGCGKIIDGKQKGQYCEIQGFDDESGRIIVKTSLQGLVLALNEFLVIPVTKEEYVKSSKVINIAMYEEYKNQESGQSRISSEPGHRRSHPYKTNYTNSKSSNTDDDNQKHNKVGEYNSKSTEKDYRQKYNDSSSDSEKEYNRKKTKERSRHRH